MPVHPADDHREPQQQVDELLGAVQLLRVAGALRAVLEGEAVVVAEDQHQAVVLLRLRELLLQPAELRLRHGTVGARDLIAGVKAEGPHEGGEVGLPPRLAGLEVVLGESVSDRARSAFRAEVLSHELGLCEQVAVGVGGNGVETRAPESDARGIRATAERTRGRGVAAEDGRRRRIQ